MGTYYIGYRNNGKENGNYYLGFPGTQYILYRVPLPSPGYGKHPKAQNPKTQNLQPKSHGDETLLTVVALNSKPQRDSTLGTQR